MIQGSGSSQLKIFGLQRAVIHRFEYMGKLVNALESRYRLLSCMRQSHCSSLCKIFDPYFFQKLMFMPLYTLFHAPRSIFVVYMQSCMLTKSELTNLLTGSGPRYPQMKDSPASSPLTVAMELDLGLFTRTSTTTLHSNLTVVAATVDVPPI